MIKESIETIVLYKTDEEKELRIVKDGESIDFLIDGVRIFGMDWTDNLKEVITLMMDKWD